MHFAILCLLVLINPDQSPAQSMMVGAGDSPANCKAIIDKAIQANLPEVFDKLREGYTVKGFYLDTASKGFPTLLPDDVPGR